MISLTLRVPRASTTNPKKFYLRTQLPLRVFASSREIGFCVHTMQVLIESSPLPIRYVPPPGAHAKGSDDFARAAGSDCIND